MSEQPNSQVMLFMTLYARMLAADVVPFISDKKKRAGIARSWLSSDRRFKVLTDSQGNPYVLLKATKLRSPAPPTRKDMRLTLSSDGTASLHEDSSVIGNDRLASAVDSSDPDIQSLLPLLPHRWAGWKHKDLGF
jgi:hypothetical protein